ncbi:MAG TPA: hypothetical protein PK771_07850, partial [Spirochaetota bacterium]|nr:hypothetical protein [Spirochaetota bacterium]
MRKIILFILIIISINVYSNEIDIQKIDFVGVNIANQKDKFDNSEAGVKYNICYSAILPAGGIYCISDSVTGKESIVQIGFSVVNHSPYIIYMPDELYKFFTSTYDKSIDKLNLKVKFIGWNKSESESMYLDLQSLVVEPDNSINEIKKNGDDKVYIQLG